MAWTPAMGARAAVTRLGQDEAVDQLCEMLRGDVLETDLLRSPWPALLLDIGNVDAVWVTSGAPGGRGHWPRAWAARALSYVGDTSAVPSLVSGTRDEHWRVRTNSVAALGRIGEVMAEPAVTRASRDLHPRVRGAAATALGRIAGPAAPAALTLLADDDDPVVAGKARQGLEQLARVD